MAFSATVLNVLIASPSDVPQERLAISEVLYEWNALNAKSTGRVLLPVKWESHSAPTMGDRPQAIINDQVVRDCDMLVGAFWTRLGSSTGVEDSGTVEEIKYFLSKQKPVMLYFSSAPVDPSKIDLDQFKKLKDFRDSIKNKGVIESYSSIEELHLKLMKQITIVVRGMSVGTTVAPSVVKEAAASVKDEKPANTVEPHDASKAIPPKPNAMEISLVDYTERAFVVRGDTRPFKKKLMDLNGRWISTKPNNEKAWMFSKRKLTEVAELLGIKPVLKENG